MGLLNAEKTMTRLGITLPELDVIVREGKLRLYWKDGDTISGPHSRFSYGRMREIQTSGACFVESDVNEYLSTYKCSNNFCENMPTIYGEIENDIVDTMYVSVDFILKNYFMSKNNLLDYINSGELRTEMDDERKEYIRLNRLSCEYNGTFYNNDDFKSFFSRENLNEVTVHINDLYSFVEDKKIEKKSHYASKHTLLSDDPLHTQKIQMETYQEASVLDEVPPLSPQQRATAARQAKTLEAWKPAIDAMIKAAVRCGAEGQRPRQQPDFNIMFNELDAELNSEQMALFRKSLPDGYIDRTGGERGKADTPLTTQAPT